MSLDVQSREVLVAGSEGTAYVVDIDRGEVRTDVHAGFGLLGACMNPAGEIACLFGVEGARLWNVSTGKLSSMVQSGWCSSVTWNENGLLLLSASDRIVVIDDQGSVHHQVDVVDGANAAAWIGKSAFAVASRTGVQAHDLVGETNNHATSAAAMTVAVSPDRRWLAAGTLDGTVQLRGLLDGQALEMRGYPTKVTRLAFSACGRFLANDGAPEVGVWDVSGIGPRASTSVRCVAPESDSFPVMFAWNPARPTLSAAWRDGSLGDYDVAKGNPGHILRAQTKSVGVGNILTLAIVGMRDALVGLAGGQIARLSRAAVAGG